VLPGVGSDEVISLLLTAFVKPLGQADAATVLTTTPSFVMYRMSARCRGLRVLEVPLDAGWDLSVDALKNANRDRAAQHRLHCQPQQSQPAI